MIDKTQTGLGGAPHKDLLYKVSKKLDTKNSIIKKEEVLGFFSTARTPYTAENDEHERVGFPMQQLVC